MFRAYVDEAGDEGMRPCRGSSRFLVVAAVVVEQEHELQLRDIVDEVRASLNLSRDEPYKIPQRKPLHYRRLPHAQKALFAAGYSRSNAQSVAVVLDKQHLSAMDQLDGNKPYHFALRHLTRRVVEMLNARAPEAPTPLHVILSQRGQQAMPRLQAELKTTIMATHTDMSLTVELHQVEILSHGKRAGLQVADALASSVFAALRDIDPERHVRGFLARSLQRVPGALLVVPDQTTSHRLLELIGRADQDPLITDHTYRGN